MRVVVVWREQSEYGRAVSEWIHELKHRTSDADIESLDPDTRDGAGFCSSYGIYRYPTIVALGDDGRVLQQWDGEMLPKIDDFAYYLISA